MTDDGWEHAKLAIGLGSYHEHLMYGVWADLLVGDLIVGEKLVIKNEDEQGNSSVTIDKNGITIKNGTISWENVNAPEISNIAGLSTELSSIRATADSATEYIEDKVSQLDQKVAQYLTQGGSTSLGENYMISPYIGGGYLNITSGDKQVVIDPSKSGNEYIFQVKSQGETMVGIKANGEALFAGEIMSTKGNIGGWQISNKNIYISGSNEENNYDIEINSENCSITSRNIRTEKYLHESGTIYKFDYCQTISIESGELKLSYKTVVDDQEIPMFEDYLLLTESSLIITSNDKTYCSIGKYGIQEKGKYLADLYGVVKTGVNALTGGNNYWELQRADFGVTYQSEPLINVMFYGSIPDSGAIVFQDYIGDSEDGYTGFTFLVYTKTPGSNHSAKWWAVGNVKK